MKGYFLLFFLFANNLLGQDITEKLTTYQSSHHLEKIYIAHDKPYYPSGDTIWCKAYYLDAQTHQANNLNPLINVDWIDPSGYIMKTITLKAKAGIAMFDIPIDPSIKSGVYTLRAYTQYQKNFDPAFIFQKNITILDGKSSIADTVKVNPLLVNFYPEGGELVAGLVNRVAYEIVGEEKLTTNQKLVLKNSRDQVILETKLKQQAIGAFDFKPKKGEQYHIELSESISNQKFELPRALDAGFVISVNGADEDHIYISVASKPKKLLHGSQLIGHVRGEIFVDQTLSKKGPNTFKIDRNQIPSGVLHFTLFSANQKPVCERLCFNYNPNSNIDVSIDLTKNKFAERENIDLSISTSADNTIIPSLLSLSVYNQDFFRMNEESLDIVNYLLLQSDLKHPITDIRKHLSNDGVINHYLLDLELMTKSWRRFKWQDVLDEENPEIKYGTQEDFQFLGMVKEKDKPVKANVNLFAAGSDLINSEMITGEDGVFYFSGLELKDTSMVIISASKYNEKQNEKDDYKPKVKNIKIEHIPIDTLEVAMSHYASRTEINQTITKTNESKKESPDVTTIPNSTPEDKLIQELVRLDSLATAEWMIDIEEIVIKDSKQIKLEERRIEIQGLYKDRGWKYSNIANMFFLDDVPGAHESYNAFNMISRVIPKVHMVLQKNGDMGVAQRLLSSADISGNTGEMAAENLYAPPGITGNPIPPRPGINLAFPILIDYQNERFQVERIDPKKIYAMEVRYNERTGAIIYINLISKNPKDKFRRTELENTLNIQHPGYYKARQFYTPNYAGGRKKNSKSDLRTTLYWKPNVQISKEPKQFSFFTGDRSGNYVIVIEGISNSGIPFVHKKQFLVD